MRPSIVTRAAQNYRIKRSLKLPAEHVYNVVGDVSRYSEFVPYCVKSTVTAHDISGKPSLARLSVGWETFDEEFDSKLVYNPTQVIARAADVAMFKDLLCEWTVQSVKSDQCLVSLLLQFQFQKSIYNLVSSQIGPILSRKMIQAFSERSYQMYKNIHSQG